MTTITEDYVSFETAKLLKENRFTEPCLYYYFSNGAKPYMGRGLKHRNSPNVNTYSAPTQQMAMRWLREVHNLHIQLFIGNDSSNDADGNEVETWYFWSFSINGLPTGTVIYNELIQFDCVEYQSYEEACEEAIKFCLENLI